MTDTHTHLYFEEDYPAGEGGGGAAVDRALAVGVSRLIFPCVDLESAEPLLALHHQYPAETFTAFGLHPTEVGPDWRQEVREISARFAEEKPVAVGEIGIDLYHDATWRSRQMDAFGEQLQMASELHLPVIIHCRSGLDETLEILSGFSKEQRPEVVFHSFTYGPEEARRILEECGDDTIFGFNGVATFKNAAEVREAVKRVGIDRIVLETDSPYLSPTPLRGRRNESSNIPLIRDVIAACCGVSPEETEQITDRNASRLFHLP